MRPSTSFVAVAPPIARTRRLHASSRPTRRPRRRWKVRSARACPASRRH
jgi:hypothetical protein